MYLAQYEFIIETDRNYSSTLHRKPFHSAMHISLNRQLINITMNVFVVMGRGVLAQTMHLYVNRSE